MCTALRPCVAFSRYMYLCEIIDLNAFIRAQGKVKLLRCSRSGNPERSPYSCAGAEVAVFVQRLVNGRSRGLKDSLAVIARVVMYVSLCVCLCSGCGCLRAKHTINLSDWMAYLSCSD